MKYFGAKHFGAKHFEPRFFSEAPVEKEAAPGGGFRRRIYRKHTTPKPAPESNRSRNRRFKDLVLRAISPRKHIEEPQAISLQRQDEAAPSIETYTRNVADNVDAFIREQENITKSKRMAVLRDDEEILLILS
jgi:hypothetical protein